MSTPDLNVLVIGGGGREHAICRALSRSPRLKKLFMLPGAGGAAALGVNVPGAATDLKLAVSVARRERIDLTIVGPEDPLAAGIVDAFEAEGLRIFGPSAAAARIEADKAFAKSLLRQCASPTAEGRVFTDFAAAREYLASRDEPLVVKAAGLARGKGVFVCPNPAEAEAVAERMLVKRAFGEAGAKIIIEERLVGREVSLLALVDGHTIVMLESAQDHKRLLDGDQGPNTGGMGAFSPAAPIDEKTRREIETLIFVPVVDALLREGIRYRGVLYAGLMLTPGGPKVLEFNCRFGDPEAQAILPRIKGDLLDVLDLATRGRLDQVEIEWDSRAALCVVLAAPGYPDEPTIGAPIQGLSEVGEQEDVAVFHAGVRRVGSQWLTAGGRVLGITALGETLAQARVKAYGAVERIHFAGMQYRRDLAQAAAGLAEPVSRRG